MPDAGRLEFHFPTATRDEAGRLADDLAALLKENNAGSEIRVERTSADTQDLGTIVILLAGTPAAIAIAKGIADWIRRQGDPDVVIKSGSDEVIVRGGLSAEQKLELVKTVLSKRKD